MSAPRPQIGAVFLRYQSHLAEVPILQGDDTRRVLQRALRDCEKKGFVVTRTQITYRFY